ncbi:unnamed protein product [Cunninghamella echinulata]
MFLTNINALTKKCTIIVYIIIRRIITQDKYMRNGGRRNIRIALGEKLNCYYYFTTTSLLSNIQLASSLTISLLITKISRKLQFFVGCGPVTQTTPRITKEGTVLSGTFIPKNTPIVVNMLGLHSNENVWKDPYTFNPDRFCPNGEAEQKNRDGHTWAPFASGPRQCIGMNFSLAEQRVMLSSILRKYELHLPENTIHKDELITNNSGVLKPIDLKIVFKPRY